MNSTLYNILWADDECGAFQNNNIVRAVLRKKQIKVHFSQNSTELRNDYNKYKDLVDAIIIDGNFSKKSVGKVDKDDMSGFVDSLALLELCNVRRTIPFFLFTSRKVSLESVFRNGELDYFSETRLIQKGSDFDMMFDTIISEIKKINSDEYQVKRKYGSLLEMAREDISDACADNLYQFLLAEKKDNSYNEGISIFNSLRNIMEEIVTSCRNNLIVPEVITELNDFMYYFTKPSGWSPTSSVEGYMPKEECKVMPKAISNSLESLIEIIQDGSHKKEDLKLYVSEYVYESQSPFLFRACMYQVMELIRWHHDTLNRMDNNDDPMTYHSWTTYPNQRYKQGTEKKKYNTIG